MSACDLERGFAQSGANTASTTFWTTLLLWLPSGIGNLNCKTQTEVVALGGWGTMLSRAILSSCPFIYSA